MAFCFGGDHGVSSRFGRCHENVLGGVVDSVIGTQNQYEIPFAADGINFTHNNRGPGFGNSGTTSTYKNGAIDETETWTVTTLTSSVTLTTSWAPGDQLGWHRGSGLNPNELNVIILLKRTDGGEGSGYSWGCIWNSVGFSPQAHGSGIDPDVNSNAPRGRDGTWAGTS